MCLLNLHQGAHKKQDGDDNEVWHTVHKLGSEQGDAVVETGQSPSLHPDISQES